MYLLIKLTKQMKSCCQVMFNSKSSIHFDEEDDQIRRIKCHKKGRVGNQKKITKKRTISNFSFKNPFSARYS